MDAYRKGWALRYLREAKAELQTARRMPYMAPSLLIEAARKARSAIHYSLGEPTFIETIIRETAEKNQITDDPLLKCLLDVEGVVQQLTQVEEVESEEAMKKTDDLVELASEIVETLTGEKTED